MEMRRDFLKLLGLYSLCPFVGSAVFNTNKSYTTLITVFSQKNLELISKIDETSKSFQQLVDLREQFIKDQLIYGYSTNHLGHLVFFETRFKDRQALQLWLSSNRRYENEIKNIGFNRFVIG